MTSEKQVSDDLVNADAHLQGDKIAKKLGYKSLSGIEAVRYYLVQKHNWFPSQVNGMSYAELSFCLEEDKF